MPEVPHNWSLGLRRPLVALLGAVAVDNNCMILRCVGIIIIMKHAAG